MLKQLQLANINNIIINKLRRKLTLNTIQSSHQITISLRYLGLRIQPCLKGLMERCQGWGQSHLGQKSDVLQVSATAKKTHLPGPAR